MDIQSYLSKKYQGHESFLENIIFPIFGEENYDTAWDVELLDSEELRNHAHRTGIRSVIRCGTINIALTPIEVFDITVADRVVMDKNRVSVQALIRRIMDTYSGAFMIIHYDNDAKWDWRFTFCQLKDKNEFTDSKRYTFLLGPNQSCKTAAQNFQKLANLQQDISIKDIQSAFDVEALSKEFFKKYKSHYERFVEYITGKRYVKESGKFEEKKIHEPHEEYYAAFDKNDKDIRDYVKLTLGRIILCHFIQKKGWLGVADGCEWGKGDENFMHNLYLQATEEQREDFLETILEPLFFEGLNTDRRNEGDLFNSCVFGNIRVPYLNGGLFEKKHSDEVKVKFPKEYFKDLLDFFYEYNFTIDENDPNEAQVGIDPEMLSQIFENLLEDNKDKGAFYTPKEIVKYMCQESLIAYLTNETNLDEGLIRRFILNPDIAVNELSDEDKQIILDAILTVKICDPAIGSGAFPIGLLNELVRCKEAILGDTKRRADIKREIIRDNIYGVDIENGAVDIARLRFWLSLIVDEEVPEPLPNLDYKIMQGDSLLEWYNGVNLSHLTDSNGDDIALNSVYADTYKSKLTELLKQYFDETNHDAKAILKDSIKKVITELLDIAGVDIPDGINIAENNRFFLWHTWFNEVFTRHSRSGFDIVIGNPPYVEAKKLKHIAKTLKKIYDVYSGTADLSIYFNELGLNLLTDNGIISYITTNKFFYTGYGEPVRKLFSSQQINVLLNFEQVEVFEDILVSSVIFNIKKAQCKEGNLFTYEKFYKLKCAEFKKEFIQRQSTFGEYNQDFLNSEEWSFADATKLMLKKKIENKLLKLKDLDGVQVFRGITTGYNPAFIITDKQCKDFIDADEKNKRIIKKLLQGRNIRKWYYNTSDENLLFIPWHFPLHKNDISGASIAAEEEFKKGYPVIYSWMKEHEEKLRERNTDETGIRYEWYALQRCAASYYTEFEKAEKIIWGLTANNWAFTLDTDLHYLPSNGYILTSASIPIKYLLGVLNSSVLHHYFGYIGVMTAGGAYTLKAATIESLPIALGTPEQQEEVIGLVNSILEAKSKDINKDVTDLEKKIDNVVYTIYGLNDADIKVIEKA